MAFSIENSARHLVLQNGSAATLKIGPFLDETDGKTPMISLSIVQADVRISKNDGDFTQKTDATIASHTENGYYDIPFNGSDINTEGTLLIAIHKIGALPVWTEYKVGENLGGGS